MSKTTPEEVKALAEKLRQVCNQVRGKSYALADLIPLLQQTADFIDEVHGVDAEPVARLHIRLDDDGLSADVEVLDGTHLQVADSPVDVYLAHPAPPQPVADVISEESLAAAVRKWFPDRSNQADYFAAAMFGHPKNAHHEHHAAPVELPVVGWLSGNEYRFTFSKPNSDPRAEPLVKLNDAQAAIAAGRKAS